MKIFIDTATGTWGDAEDIVTLDVGQAILDMMNAASDSEIVDFGDRHGKRLPFAFLNDY